MEFSLSLSPLGSFGIPSSPNSGSLPSTLAASIWMARYSSLPPLASFSSSSLSRRSRSRVFISVGILSLGVM
mgnify:CR=1 FL=1